MAKFFSIMHIDDNSIDHMIQNKVFEKSSFAEMIYNHQSGISALESLKNLLNLNPLTEQNLLPEYIFLDLDMPLMDGFQFMSEFEKLPQSETRAIKIILLTASISRQDKEFPKKFDSFHSFIQKPLTVEKLKNL